MGLDLSPENAQALIAHREWMARRQPPPAERLPVVLGAITPERTTHIEVQALRRAAREARSRARKVLAPPRGDLDWEDLLAIARWLEEYADGLEQGSQTRREA